MSSSVDGPSSFHRNARGTRRSRLPRKPGRAALAAGMLTCTGLTGAPAAAATTAEAPAAHLVGGAEGLLAADQLGPAALRGGPLGPQVRLVHKLPAPPDQVGCYRYTAGNGWHRRPCLSSVYVLAHFPHPAIGGSAPVVGVQEGAVAPGPHAVWLPPSKPLEISWLRADDIAFGSESDTSLGPDAYSMQINTNGFGLGGADWVQFVNQSRPVNAGTRGFNLSLVCVWQNDFLLSKPLQPTGCSTYSGSFAEIEGWASEGTLGVAVANPGGTSSIAGIVPDQYGLGTGLNWNFTSGSLLGYSGSQAVFTNTEMVFYLAASGCVNDGFLVGFSEFCSSHLRGDAYVNDLTGAQAVPPTGSHYWRTAESNNLQSVFGTPPGPKGSPPGVFPPLSWYGLKGETSAELVYSATTTGSCWTGSPCGSS